MAFGVGNKVLEPGEAYDQLIERFGGIVGTDENPVFEIPRKVLETKGPRFSQKDKIRSMVDIANFVFAARKLPEELRQKIKIAFNSQEIPHAHFDFPRRSDDTRRLCEYLYTSLKNAEPNAVSQLRTLEHPVFIGPVMIENLQENGCVLCDSDLIGFSSGVYEGHQDVTLNIRAVGAAYLRHYEHSPLDFCGFPSINLQNFKTAASKREPLAVILHLRNQTVKAALPFIG